MFVQEVNQYKELFQGIKWRLRFTGEAAWKGIDVRMEELEVIEGQSIIQAYHNETGVMVTDTTRISNSQLDQCSHRHEIENGKPQMMQNYTNNETYLPDIRCPYTKHKQTIRH
jgi:hypothetical protein